MKNLVYVFALKHTCLMNETITSRCSFTASRLYMRRKKACLFGGEKPQPNKKLLLSVSAALYSAVMEWSGLIKKKP